MENLQHLKITKQHLCPSQMTISTWTYDLLILLILDFVCVFVTAVGRWLRAVLNTLWWSSIWGPSVGVGHWRGSTWYVGFSLYSQYCWFSSTWSATSVWCLRVTSSPATYRPVCLAFITSKTLVNPGSQCTCCYFCLHSGVVLNQTLTRPVLCKLVSVGVFRLLSCVSLAVYAILIPLVFYAPVRPTRRRQQGQVLRPYRLLPAFTHAQELHVSSRLYDDLSIYLLFLEENLSELKSYKCLQVCSVITQWADILFNKMSTNF